MRKNNISVREAHGELLLHLERFFFFREEGERERESEGEVWDSSCSFPRLTPPFGLLPPLLTAYPFLFCAGYPFLSLSFFLSKHFKDLFLSSTISVVEINLEGRKNKIKLKFQSLHHKEEENRSRLSMNDCILGTKS